MAQKVQILRSDEKGERPKGKLVGEPYVNFKDGAFGVVDREGKPIDFANANVAKQLSARNRLINGNFLINQYSGGSATTIANAFPAKVFVADRWGIYVPLANAIQSNTTATNLASTVPTIQALTLTSLIPISIATGNVFTLIQVIEDVNIADINWGTANALPVTLSFWVMATDAGKYGGSIRNNGGSRSYPFSYTIKNPSAWEYITITIPGDKAGSWATGVTNGYLFLDFDLGSGSTYQGAPDTWQAGDFTTPTGMQNFGVNGGTFNITNVQLEVGSVATPFEWKLFQSELANCLRYYEVIYEMMWSGNITSGSAYYLTTLLALKASSTPTATVNYINGAGFPVGAPTNYGANMTYLQISNTATTTGAGFFQYSATVSSEL